MQLALVNGRRMNVERGTRKNRCKSREVPECSLPGCASWEVLKGLCWEELSSGHLPRAGSGGDGVGLREGRQKDPKCQLVRGVHSWHRGNILDLCCIKNK